MAILINENTRVLVQGITGNVGAFQSRIMKAYGTNIIAGVTPASVATARTLVPSNPCSAKRPAAASINARRASCRSCTGGLPGPF